MVVIAGLSVLSPIDLIPEFLPVNGPLDDVVVVALAFRYTAASPAETAAQGATAASTAEPDGRSATG